MKLVDISNVMAFMDENEVMKIFQEKFSDLKHVTNWAVQGLPGEDNESDFWPVVDGKILSWSYPRDYVISVIKLLTAFDKDYSFLVCPDISYPLPLVVRIKKQHPGLNELYFLVSPRTEEIS